MTAITILDGYTTNPGDNPWTEIEQLGEVTVYDRTPDDEIVERAKGQDVLVTNKTPLRADTFDQLDSLEFITILATGFDVVDIRAAAERGIPVSNVPAYSADSVAEHTFGLLLELTHRIGLHDRAVQQGEWSESPDFTFWKRPIRELKDKTLGIVGFGDIGRRVGRIGSAFGMSVLAATRESTPDPDWGPFTHVESVDDVFRESDFVTLHCPLTDETRGLVGRRRLEQMAEDAYLVNTARGGVIDEVALADALAEGLLAGAAVDVASEEPINEDNPLLTAPNCIITPHIAWTSQEARRRLVQTTADNIEAYQAGQPINVVNDV